MLAHFRDGVWMAYRPDPYRVPVFGNVTIIVTKQDVVVVDAGSSPRAARRVIDKIRALTDLPVSTLINTHGHEDHVGAPEGLRASLQRNHALQWHGWRRAL